MARKKADPQVTENLNTENIPPVEKKKTGNKKEKTEPEITVSEDIQPPLKKAKARQKKVLEDVAPEEQPTKKTPKKAAKKTKEISESLPETTAATETTTAEEAKPVKKSAARKSSIKKEITREPEAITEPVTFTEDATKTIEHIEPVTVPEKKNESVVHKLSVAAEHHNVSASEQTNPADTTITFIVNYYTNPGQALFITAAHPLFGNGNTAEAVPMQFLDSQHWKADITIQKNDLNEDIVYHYFLKEEDGSVVYDGGKEKKLSASLLTGGSVIFLDAWDFEGYYDNAFFTEPFKNVLLNNAFSSGANEDITAFTHLFKIKAPLLAPGQVACLTGSSESLTNWNRKEPLLLHKKKEEDFWQIKLNLSDSDFPVNYKYGIYDVNKKETIQLENGENRVLSETFTNNSKTIVNDGFIRTSDNTWKGTGVAIPVFSLRTETSFGCGEFTDIKKLADWCKIAGLKLIQILPVNDTTATKTWRDSYPYAAISAFALHAMYLNANVMMADENKHITEKYREEARRLNQLHEVDYEAVNDMKWKIIHEIYPLQKEATFNSADYKSFFENNQHWLVPYAAFCCLRDNFNTADFNKWNEYKTFDTEIISKLFQSDEQKDRAGMYYFVQYHLHLQLKEAAAYAHENGIVIKGDIPIGISCNSADAWQQPQLFNMDMQAGAPPDSFAVKGQNWGFPTYNWKKMREDGFAWWKQRFSQMSNYFDAFRIDHILGFFRIWSIPTDSVEGIMGHFVPALPVQINEFYQWNTYFDYKRYCKPFINDQILNDLFGDQQWYVKDTFLLADNDGTYSLRPEVETQKRVETYFAIHNKNAHNEWLKSILFNIISNVILFEEKGSNGQQFHFRYGMEATLSYQYLDDYTKKQLYYLSINYFYERQNEFWRNEAMQKLPALKQVTDMLICGEDLGMVPASVPRVMHELGLLSLEVQRMPKDEKLTFTNLETAPYLSVVTPSTHDMSTVRGWWEEDRNTTQNFYNNQLGHGGNAPKYCEPWINRQIVEQHLYSPAMWSIFQLQDLLGIDGDLRRQNPNDERINVPAIPNYYWRYRMHITLEDLMKAEDFNNELKNSISASGR